MVIDLQQHMDRYAQEIKESNPDYGSIYNYFVDYINNIAYKEEIELSDFFNNELSKGDIKKACAYYYENSNAYTVTAVEKFLNAMSKFYIGYMKEKGYENSNLQTLYPFSKLKNDVFDYISSKELNEKEVNPAIEESDFEYICNYLNTNKKPSIVERQISIIFKLLMLYGFKLERLKNIEKEKFDSGTRLMTIDIEEKKQIILELPLSLTLEIEDYLAAPKCNLSKFMFRKSKDSEIDPGFLSYHFGKIKEKMHNNEDKNKFTSTGLAKYAIINMLKAGMNVPVIKMITGMEDDVINDCTKKVYGLNQPKYLNRYINSTVRAVETYDELGVPVFLNY